MRCPILIARVRRKQNAPAGASACVWRWRERIIPSMGARVRRKQNAPAGASACVWRWRESNPRPKDS
ncbi:MAG: hypothetical protein RMJ85_15915, partial [Anaerolineales bacterium]|nr:hypothetical protein [Anaerolineales bacterium]